MMVCLGFHGGFLNTLFEFISFKRDTVHRGKGICERLAAVVELSRERFSFLDRSQLVKIKTRATRAGVWYKALPRIDRVLVDLTIGVAQGIRSVHLAQCLLSVVRKLEGALESRVARAVREIGVPLAQKLSAVAQSWGNSVARAWAFDAGFARYLAMMGLNG